MGEASARTAAMPGESYQDILDRDSRPVPALLRENRPGDLGTAPVPARRYTSRDFFEREVEKVWLKTWQYACREEEIPNTGDTHVFELLDRSVILIRQHDGAVRAFRNVCLHRGRKLVTRSECRNQLRCPYHGMTWNIDGSFRTNPFAWDFPQIDESRFSLPEIRSESWAGFIFVNFDDDAPPLLEQLAPMPEHFRHWRIDDCYKAAHVAKVAPANWKVCAEAFLETLHVLTTHPQTLAFTALETSQCDLLSDHVTRFMTAIGVTGSHWPDPSTSEEVKLRRMLGVRLGKAAEGDAALLAGEQTARAFAADFGRRTLEEEIGGDFSSACDADVLDSISYDFFPNFHLWGGLRQKICYRFRPVGLDHEATLVEVMLYKIAPVGQERPEPAALRVLGDDEPWASATELNYLAGIYDQDQSNFGAVQEGLRALADGEVHFSRYAEMRCRNLHRMIDRYMAA